jgi:hypothetical protein
VKSLSSGPDWDAAITYFIPNLARRDPQAALQMMKEKEERWQYHTEAVMTHWARKDLEAAVAAAESLTSGPAATLAACTVAGVWAENSWLDAVADFQPVPTRIFKEDGVVARLVGNRSLDVAGPGVFRDVCDAIHLVGAFGPERDAVLVGDVTRRLGDAEEFGDVAIGCFKLQPTIDGNFAGEAQSGQQLPIELRNVGEARHPQINVVVTARHGFSDDPVSDGRASVCEE